MNYSTHCFHTYYLFFLYNPLRKLDCYILFFQFWQINLRNTRTEVILRVTWVSERHASFRGLGLDPALALKIVILDSHRGSPAWSSSSTGLWTSDLRFVKYLQQYSQNVCRIFAFWFGICFSSKHFSRLRIN